MNPEACDHKLITWLTLRAASELAGIEYDPQVEIIIAEFNGKFGSTIYSSEMFCLKCRSYMIEYGSESDQCIDYDQTLGIVNAMRNITNGDFES